MLDLMCDMLVSCWSGFSLLNYFFWFCSRNVMMSLPVFQFKQGKKVVYGCSELFNASQFIKQVSHNTSASQNQWLHLEPHGCLNGPTQTKYVFGILTVETADIVYDWTFKWSSRFFFSIFIYSHEASLKMSFIQKRYRHFRRSRKRLFPLFSFL